jgi:hypothetical protein
VKSPIVPFVGAGFSTDSERHLPRCIGTLALTCIRSSDGCDIQN